MLRVALVSPVFPPEPVVSGKTTHDIALALAARGDDVTVLTAFPSRPAGRLYPGWSRRLYSRKILDAHQRIVRCFSLLSPRSRLVSRLAENISFGITSSLALLARPRPDVIYANTWPIFAAGMIALVARLRRIPLVISIQDIYPESLLSQDRIKANGPIAAALKWIDARIARSASAVIVISESFARVYREDRGVEPSRVLVVPNWGDAAAPAPQEVGLAVRDEMGIPRAAFLLVYGGNIGAAAGVEFVVEAMQRFGSTERPYLLIAGSGTQLDECRRLAQNIDPERIRFYTPWPVEKTAAVYAAGDVLLLPTRGAQSLASVPSKLISQLLAARPVLAQALPNSDTAATIELARCGWVVAPEDKAALFQAIRRSRAASSEERSKLGKAGRAYALQYLTKDACLPAALRILDEAAGSRRVARLRLEEENAPGSR